ncbi:hypothetical protein F383_04061 [Gossypium arboreum]|uniref:Uncharacterized protein n=1 Tax=Gossypium arboreum TaxID=29729 RepID=A0A0B0P1M3_GOSAR|nr:hypothetical protein F383_04061 [Gossypium arboreum]
MGQRKKSTWLGLFHTGRPHTRAYLVESSMTYTGRPHARV